MRRKIRGSFPPPIGLCEQTVRTVTVDHKDWSPICRAPWNPKHAYMHVSVHPGFKLLDNHCCHHNHTQMRQIKSPLSPTVRHCVRPQKAQVHWLGDHCKHIAGNCVFNGSSLGHYELMWAKRRLRPLFVQGEQGRCGQWWRLGQTTHCDTSDTCFRVNDA